METHAWRAALLLSCVVCGTVSAQPDPTLEQVYSEARSGHVQQALQMMRPVLRDHPGSPKAHYVEAELLAHQGDVGAAKQELATAEHLSPGLAFARPEAVQELRQTLDRASAAPHQGYSFDAGPDPEPHFVPPWGALIGLFGGLAMAWFVWMLLRPRTATAWPMSGPGAGTPSWTGSTAMPPPGGGGLGSALAGGLATGLGVGAGVVAAEAIGEHFLHRDAAIGDRLVPTASTYAPADTAPADADPDFGGSDFGIQNDAGGWDDGGGSDSSWDA